ncbi:MAG TPA: DUF1616 domain-containing protein [Chloroflexia bacterium]|nr:DUF1616 domain-containing protein [Chloroflexia bacterium]
MALRERERAIDSQNLDRERPLAGGDSRRLDFRSGYDLLLVALLALLVPLMVGLELTPWLRVPLGLVAVLFAPGYALTEAIFAHRADQDGVARLALSFGLSAAGLPLLALILNSLPWGIRLWPMVISLSAWTLLAVAVAAFRRWRLAPAGEASNPPPLRPLGWWSAHSRPVKAGYIAGLLLLLLVGAYAAWVFLSPNPAERFTEFYALGSEGLAENYPREVLVGQDVELRLGIVNREGQTATYRVEARQDGHTLSTLGPVTLQPGQKWEQPIHYRLTNSGPDQVVDILLFYNGQPAPYRSLRLWINVKQV